MTMLIHNIIKTKYVKLGYLKKNYPYHLISDEEMFNAFIDLGNANFNKTTTMVDSNVHYFNDYYPNPFEEEDYIYTKKNAKGEVVAEISLKSVYEELSSYIISEIKSYLSQLGTTMEHELPDWIYTYMLGEVVYQKSEYLDIFDTLNLLGDSNLDNEFTREACVDCYITSSSYISTLTTGVRPPTIFGEPHVIKCLRLES